MLARASGAVTLLTALMFGNAAARAESVAWWGNSFLTRFQMTQENDQMTLVKRY